MFKYRKIRSKIQKMCIKCVCVLATLLQPTTTVVIKPQVANTNVAQLDPNNAQIRHTEAIPSQLFQPLTLNSQQHAPPTGSENIPTAHFQLLQNHAAMPVNLSPTSDAVVPLVAKQPQYIITSTKQTLPSSATYNIRPHTFHIDSNRQQVVHLRNTGAQFHQPNVNVQHSNVNTVPQNVGNRYQHGANHASSPPAGAPTVIHEYHIYVPRNAML